MKSNTSMVTVGFKVTLEHKAHLILLAKEKGMIISDYLRSLVPELPKNGTYLHYEEYEQKEDDTSKMSDETKNEKAKPLRSSYMDLDTAYSIIRMNEIYKGLMGLFYVGLLMFNSSKK